jgi:TolA-binding protein
MRRVPPAFDVAVGAFREMTAEPADGAATRARVLAGAQRSARWRRLARPGLITLAIACVLSSSAAALTAAGVRWRAPASYGIVDAPGETRAPATARVNGPVRIVPALRADDATPPLSDRADGERHAYERAHRAHFFLAAPARALTAWDEYLAAYPRGTFAPEARYNRALCLVRLGRFGAAADGLRPFAAGRPGDYRREEACRLLYWLAERDARIELPLCPVSE